VEGDIQVGRWLVQPKLNSISGKDKTAHVEPKAMQVLLYLAEHAGDVMPKGRIMQAVWAGTFVTDDVLTRAISELRKAFEDDPHEPRFIQTVAKGGYRLIAPVEPVGADLRVRPPEGARLGAPLRRRWIVATAGAASAVVAAVLFTLNVAGLRDRMLLRPKAPGGKIMLVVLPLENLSGDPEQEYFSDGITEEITAQLGRLSPERVGVIGRATAMTYKGAKKTIDQIGTELHVQYVLEGSFRRAGNRVRVTAQLIEVGNQSHVWAESYDRDLGDALVVQSEVAQAVANQIELKLTPQQQARLATHRPVNAEAYELYLRGKYYYERGEMNNAQKAQVCFQQAIEKDPQYAPAYAGLALAYPYFANVTGVPLREAVARSRELALKALEIDPDLAEGHQALAAFEFSTWNWAACEREHELAISLNPNYAEAREDYAEFLSVMGRHNQALAEVEQAHELDPLSPLIYTQVGFTYYWARRPDEAIAQFKSTLELDPTHARAHIGLGRAYISLRRFDEGIAEMEKGVASWGTQRGGLLGYALAAGGRREEAGKMLRRYLRLGKRLRPCDVAMFYAGLGDKNMALAWLERAFDERFPGMVVLKVEPFFDTLRSEPRFQALLRRMNFPP
jgi:TolB-like protein/DNA-binding winged helix-turn-helix (wHTH) protein/Flp pilus assembly protein TadD